MPTLSNLEIAEIFLRIGDMMDYLDENTFKTRSYWNAAEMLRRLEEPVAEMAEKGELIRIRGVGEAIEGKIEEILAGGTCRLYEELKAAVPEGVQDLLRKSTLTPRLTRIVHRSLGVVNKSGLWPAVEKHDLESITQLNQNDRAHVLRAALASRNGGKSGKSKAVRS